LAHHDPIGLIAPNAGLAQLNERSRDIFRQIVESYLATGEPVGSRNISRLIAVPLSPASVRNVMSDLEALGLIYAPHTSAGRLPTELGLRFFVDALMRIGDLSNEDRKRIEGQVAAAGKSVENVLTEASVSADEGTPGGNASTRFSTWPSSLTSTTSARSGSSRTNSMCFSRELDLAVSTTAAARVRPDSRVRASPNAASTDCARPTEASWVWIDWRSSSVRSPICIRASTKKRKPSSVGRRPAEVCGA